MDQSFAHEYIVVKRVHRLLLIYLTLPGILGSCPPTSSMLLFYLLLNQLSKLVGGFTSNSVAEKQIVFLPLINPIPLIPFLY